MIELNTPTGRFSFYKEDVLYMEEGINDSREANVQCYIGLVKGGASWATDVTDSYDLFNAVENIWGGELKQEVLDSGAPVIVRPDSGDPVAMVLTTVRLLDDKFGSTENNKGFRVLNPAVRVIQGDGICYETISQILFTLKLNGYSVDNVAFGMGGALLQHVNRDTFQFAMKCSAIIKKDGEIVEVYKDPITDQGKKSKRGILRLVKDDFGGYRTCRDFEVGDQQEILKTVFLNGKVTKEYSFTEVRENAEP